MEVKQYFFYIIKNVKREDKNTFKTIFIQSVTLTLSHIILIIIFCFNVSFTNNNTIIILQRPVIQ